MKIMIVDDSKMQQHLLVRLLQELGYQETIICNNIDEAKRKLATTPVGLIFSDWHMPGGTGLDLLKCVKADPQKAKIPFIMITTEHEKQNILEALKQGMQNYILKPVDKETLKKKLYDLAEKHGIPPPNQSLAK